MNYWPKFLRRGCGAIICTLTVSALVLPTAQAKTLASKVFNENRGSAAVILAYDSNGRVVSQGSAVAITSNTLLTNAHVVAEADSVSVKIGSREYSAVIALFNEVVDLALLYAPTIKMRPVSVNYSALEIGGEVFSLGAPHGLELTISQGIVSAIRKIGTVDLTQTSAAISPGSSGGGLFNASGELIGITTWQFRDAQNLNFAVATSQFEVLKNHGDVSKRTTRKSAEPAQPSHPLVEGSWYVIFVGDDHLVLLNPETYRSYGSSVSYSEVTYDFSGEYSGERSEVRIEIDCAKWISRTISDVSISNWESGRFKERWSSKGTWKSPKTGSVLEVQSKWACAFSEKGRGALVTELTNAHDYFYGKALSKGVSVR
jgi:hypothetical protein